MEIKVKRVVLKLKKEELHDILSIFAKVQKSLLTPSELRLIRAYEEVFDDILFINPEAPSSTPRM